MKNKCLVLLAASLLSINALSMEQEKNTVSIYETCYNNHLKKIGETYWEIHYFFTGVFQSVQKENVCSKKPSELLQFFIDQNNSPSTKDLIEIQDVLGKKLDNCFAQSLKSKNPNESWKEVENLFQDHLKKNFDEKFEKQKESCIEEYKIRHKLKQDGVIVETNIPGVHVFR